MLYCVLIGYPVHCGFCELQIVVFSSMSVWLCSQGSGAFLSSIVECFYRCFRVVVCEIFLFLLYKWVSICLMLVSRMGCCCLWLKVRMVFVVFCSMFGSVSIFLKVFGSCFLWCAIICLVV